ncbi:class I SAM-dependent methyltransferase [bacterium]|nr:class I SAM-dependent methyltransferase [bacterium]
MNDYISEHDNSAAEYERQVKNVGWFVHDLLFGLCYEYINKGDKLLDLGIGTGLSSCHFAKAGVQVYGLDGSSEMLKVCESKKIAIELKLFDLTQKPYPYQSASFDIVISCGVFQFFENLELIMFEARRLLRRNGILSFIIKSYMENKEDIEIIKLGKIYSEVSPEGLAVFMHTNSYIRKMLRNYGFIALKEIKFFAPVNPEVGDELFTAFVAKKD